MAETTPEINVRYIVEAYEPYFVPHRNVEADDSCWSWHDIDASSQNEDQARQDARYYAGRQRRNTRVRRVTTTIETTISIVLGNAAMTEYRGDPPLAEGASEDG